MTKSDSDFTSDQPQLKQILDLALEKKASNIVALDVRAYLLNRFLCYLQW